MDRKKFRFEIDKAERMILNLLFMRIKIFICVKSLVIQRNKQIIGLRYKIQRIMYYNSNVRIK